MKKIIILFLLLISNTVIYDNDSIIFKVNYIYTFKDAKESKRDTFTGYTKNAACH